MAVIRLLFLALLVLVLAVVAAGAYIYLSTGGRPVVVENVTLYLDPEMVTPRAIPVDVVVELVNRTPLSLTIEQASIDVYLEAVRLATVTISDQVVSSGSNSLSLTVTLDPALVDEALVAHLSTGERSSLRLTGNATVALGPLSATLPVSATRVLETSVFPAEVEIGRSVELPGLGSVIVERAIVEVAEVGLDTVEFNVYVVIVNDSRVPVYVGNIAFEVAHKEAGEPLVYGEVADRVLIEPGKTVEVLIPSTLLLDALPDAVYYHLRNGEKSTLEIRVWFFIDAAGVRVDIGREAPIAVERAVETSFFEKR